LSPHVLSDPAVIFSVSAQGGNISIAVAPSSQSAKTLSANRPPPTNNAEATHIPTIVMLDMVSPYRP
jgi:hypothetical protein